MDNALSPNEIHFQFRFVKNGDAAGFGAKKGVARENGLTLGQWELPLERISATVSRDKRLVLVVDAAGLDEKLAKEIQDGVLVLEIYKWNAELLKNWIDERISRRLADEKKRELNHLGQSDQFRAETCPNCRATIEVSGQTKASYLYCGYCESTFRAAQSGGWESSPEAKGAKAGQCEDCGFWGRIKGYTEFYFYFLVYIYGWRSKRLFICDSCADRIFWKNAAINFPFVLGTPSALILKTRAVSGRDANWKKLAKANKMARKSNASGAAFVYEELLQTWPEHPGLLFDLALARTLAGEIDTARNFAQRALKSCPNYEPAQRIIEKLDEFSRGGASGPTTQMAPQNLGENPLTTHI